MYESGMFVGGRCCEIPGKKKKKKRQGKKNYGGKKSEEEQWFCFLLEK